MYMRGKKIDSNFSAVWLYVREYVGYICVIYLDMWHGGGGKVSMFGVDFILAWVVDLFFWGGLTSFSKGGTQHNSFAYSLWIMIMMITFIWSLEFYVNVPLQLP